MALYINLPSIAEEKLYIDEDTEYKYFQSDLSHEAWTENKIFETRTPLNKETSYWVKLCQENMKEKSNVQQEIVNMRISMEARDVWKLKEFTMYERLFETEEKLKDARHQFQKTASDMEDWASLEYLYWRRDTALEELGEMRQQMKRSVKHHSIQAVYNQDKPTKLPQIKKAFRGKTVKETNRPISTVLSPLEPVVQSPKNGIKGSPKATQQRLRGGVQLQETIDNDMEGAHSKLPIRNPKLSTEEFLSFWSSKKIGSVQRSKLPVPNLQKSNDGDISHGTNIFGSLSKNKIPLKKSVICSPVNSISENDLNSEKIPGKEKLAMVHADGNPGLPLSPIPPVGNHRVGTSTHLRRRHFKSK
ncbi:uncharacterized protein LOC133195465 [Saccostrea echinata]|uniref:uncharacterized protein LOC133195465 n=1 Tax=Saccostrea echinata TaxID=191078 RepID=UPI002A80F2BF|nr:uncharacterized protein LOC133195465 [Saccostrea echinata]